MHGGSTSWPLKLPSNSNCSVIRSCWISKNKLHTEWEKEKNCKITNKMKNLIKSFSHVSPIFDLRGRGFFLFTSSSRLQILQDRGCIFCSTMKFQIWMGLLSHHEQEMVILMCISIYTVYYGTLYFLTKQDTAYMKIRMNNNILLSVHERNLESEEFCY